MHICRLKVCPDSAVCTKACHDKDLEKSHVYSAAHSKANYEKDFEASHTVKDKGMCYFVCVHLIICDISKYSLKPGPNNSVIDG